jgi:predicted site-specific integrase-resolvase
VEITAEHQSTKELKTTNTKLTKVRLYARVSTQEQVEGVSIENQLAHLNAYATVQNWQVTGEDVDAGYSGGDDKRPALRHLLMDAKRGEFNVIASPNSTVFSVTSGYCLTTFTNSNNLASSLFRLAKCSTHPRLTVNSPFRSWV